MRQNYLLYNAHDAEAGKRAVCSAGFLLSGSQEMLHAPQKGTLDDLTDTHV